jgi:hypothetical protein
VSQITQTITLTSDQHYGRRLPSEALGKALRAIPEVVERSISMAFRGRSSVRGSRPGWLHAAADIRFIDHRGDDASTLVFEVPRLGDAASQLYRHQEFFWSSHPGPDDTGFDLLGDVLTDVANRNEDSDRYDPQLLRRLAAFRTVLDRTFDEMRIVGHRYTADRPARLTREIVTNARELYSRGLMPQRVRIAGTLDMIRASTQTFTLKLEDGQEVQGVLAGADIDALKERFRQRVLVLGRAVYRASGHVLRIEADEIQLATDGDHFFATLPKSRRRRFDLRNVLREQAHKKGVDAILGRWPGDETDEVIEQALEEMS